MSIVMYYIQIYHILYIIIYEEYITHVWNTYHNILIIYVWIMIMYDKNHGKKKNIMGNTKKMIMYEWCITIYDNVWIMYDNVLKHIHNDNVWIVSIHIYTIIIYHISVHKCYIYIYTMNNMI